MAADLIFDSTSSDAILFLIILNVGIVMPFFVALAIEIGNARKNRCAWRNNFGRPHLPFLRLLRHR